MEPRAVDNDGARTALPSLGRLWLRALEPWLALADAGRMWEAGRQGQVANEEQDAAIARVLKRAGQRYDIAA